MYRGLLTVLPHFDHRPRSIPRRRRQHGEHILFPSHSLQIDREDILSNETTELQLVDLQTLLLPRFRSSSFSEDGAASVGELGELGGTGNELLLLALLVDG